MLYNEYRPQLFKDIVGQEKTAEIIRNQVKSDKVAHAYLFCGTRGTGKTTTAKILAKAVNNHDENGEPILYSDISKDIDNGRNLDVQEIDAASKRKIADMRDIISSLKYPPQFGKYKVIILDEVHMLTQEAVNAFLKTLEEPPENVIFILATTDPQELPVTILSRCQKFDFKRISVEDIFSRLSFIAKNENIKIDEKSLKLIAKVSDGAMRDAISLLDKIKDLDIISYEKVLEILGVAGNSKYFNLCKAIFERNILSALNIIGDLDKKGIDFNIFMKELVTFFRNLLIAKVSKGESSSNINMSDEDIKELIDFSGKLPLNRILEVMNIFQNIVSKDRISLEVCVVKAINLSNASSGNPTQPESKSKSNTDKIIVSGPSPNPNNNKSESEEKNVNTSASQNQTPTDNVNSIDVKKIIELCKKGKQNTIHNFISNKNLYKVGYTLKRCKTNINTDDENRIYLLIDAECKEDKELLNSHIKQIETMFKRETSLHDNLKVSVR